MQLLFLVIKRIELVDEIMRSLAQAGIRGGTVIDSVGMAKSISTITFPIAINSCPVRSELIFSKIAMRMRY